MKTRQQQLQEMNCFHLEKQLVSRVKFLPCASYYLQYWCKSCKKKVLLLTLFPIWTELIGRENWRVPQVFLFSTKICKNLWFPIKLIKIKDLNHISQLFINSTPVLFHNWTKQYACHTFYFLQNQNKLRIFVFWTKLRLDLLINLNIRKFSNWFL